MNCLRVAKAPTAWTTLDLSSYNISVITKPKWPFFGTTIFDTPRDPERQANLAAFAQEMHMYGGYEASLIRHMRRAYPGTPVELPRLNKFTELMLKELGYDEYQFEFNRQLRFPICGEPYTASPSICLIKQGRIKSIVRIFKYREKGIDPETRVVTDAIAAFTENNLERQRRDLPPLYFDIFPAICMLSAQPIFYKIPISIDLTTAIARGEYPETETKVLKHTPEVSVKDVYAWGLVLKDNRWELMRYLSTFRKFLVRY